MWQTDRRTDRGTSCDGIVRAMHTRRAVKTTPALAWDCSDYGHGDFLLHATGALAKWTKYRRARAYCFAQRHVVCLYICPERYTLPKASYFGRLVCHALHIFLFYVCRLSSVMVQVGSGSLVDSVELVTLNLKRNFTQQLSSLVLSWACFDYPFNEHN